MKQIPDMDENNDMDTIELDAVPEIKIVGPQESADLNDGDQASQPTPTPAFKMRHLHGFGKSKNKNKKANKKVSPDNGKLAVRCESESVARANRTTVYVQIVFIKLGEIDTVKENFTADVFIQARWREPKLDGVQKACSKNPDAIKFDKYWNPKLYIDNTVGDPKETIGHTVVYDMNTWEAFIMERRRVKGAFVENLELFQFPFDTQDLTIKLISERPVDEVSMVDDPDQYSTINVESFVDEQEWRLYNEVETFTDVVSKFYQGDTAENSAHLMFACRTHASRRPGFYLTSIFLVMCFICSMTFTTFSVDYMKRENRLQLTFILLLTTVTFKFAVNSQLPRISYLTNMDVYILTSMAILILVCIWHAILPFIGNDWGEPIARKSDMAIVISLGGIYVLFHIIYALCICIQAFKRQQKYLEKERKHKLKLKKDTHNLQDIRRASTIAARISKKNDIQNSC